jgi:hypothetical protein
MVSSTERAPRSARWSMRLARLGYPFQLPSTGASLALEAGSSATREARTVRLDGGRGALPGAGSCGAATSRLSLSAGGRVRSASRRVRPAPHRAGASLSSAGLGAGSNQARVIAPRVAMWVPPADSEAVRQSSTPGRQGTHGR